jgi:hypothetical protein
MIISFIDGSAALHEGDLLLFVAFMFFFRQFLPKNRMSSPKVT